MKFKNEYTFEQRKDEARRVISKYPDKFPIICEKSDKSDSIPLINKKKFLVSHDVTVGQFIFIIRNRMKLPPQKAIFLIINGIIPPSNSLINSIYDAHKDKDGFLYINYTGENTFG